MFRRSIHAVGCNRLSRFFSVAGVDASGATAVVFGGFGFEKRQMAKHEALYTAHNFGIRPVLSSISQLTSPAEAESRGKELAQELMKLDQDLVVHGISGSIWTMMYMFSHMDPAWREERLKAIVFDSCPPKSDIYAFGGWLSFATKQPWVKPYLSWIFHPYRAYKGIDAEWEAEFEKIMFGPDAVVPRSAHCLFMHGRNDPVLDQDYVSSVVEDIQKHANPGANVQVVMYEKARHAMAVVESPEEYKAAHVEHLLGLVPEWQLQEQAYIGIASNRKATVVVE